MINGYARVNHEYRVEVTVLNIKNLFHYEICANGFYQTMGSPWVVGTGSQHSCISQLSALSGIEEWPVISQILRTLNASNDKKSIKVLENLFFQTEV